MPKKILNAAVIGVGNMGQHHARIYKELSSQGVHLIAVCDSDLSRAKDVAEKNNCKYYSSVTKMFLENRIDLVSVAVPTFLHQQIISQLAKFKPNILLEKPVAPNLKDAKEIGKYAKAIDKVFVVGYVERFNPAVVRLKNMLDNGVFGDIISLVSRRVGINPPLNKEIGVTVDLAIHDIDIFYYLLRKLPKKIAFHKRVLIDKFGEDCVSIFLDYGFTNGFIQANWITPIKIRKLYITGTKGYAELDYITQELTTYKRVDRIRKAGKVNGLSNVLRDVPLGTKQQIEKKEPLKMEIEEFVKCVRSNKKPINSFVESLQSLKVVLDGDSFK